MNTSLLSLCFGFAVLIGPIVGQELDRNVTPRITIYHYPSQSYPGFLRWEDSPVFAAYSDTVVWQRGWVPTLTSLSVTNIRSADGIVRKVEDLMATHGGKRYILTASSEPERTTICSQGKTLTILGNWRQPRVFEAEDGDDLSLFPKANDHERELWLTLPHEVRATLTEVMNFDAQDRRAWRPERLLLLLYSPTTATREVIDWPTEWPQTSSPISSTSNMQRIELPGRMLDDLLKRIPDDGEPKAIRYKDEVRYARLLLVFPGGVSFEPK